MSVKEITFHQELKQLMDELVNLVFDVTKFFPSDERFELTSQLKRAALSIILNYIEGFARQRKAVMKNFYEISYGSLKETKYLLYFSFKRKYLSENDYKKALALTERIGKMLWGILKNL